MDDFKAKVSAELDTSKIEQQLDELNGKKIKLDIDTGDTSKEVQNVNKQIVNTRKSTQSFGDTLKKSLNIGAAASLTSEAFGAIRTAADKATDAIKDIDGAVTDLRMATNGSYGDTLKLVQGYNMLGQRIGAITTEVSDSADAWLRQGHSISETNTLIKDSMILSKVAKLDSADSTEYLTSAMKGYKVEVENVIGIVDKLTAVDLVSATDAGGLAEAMSRTAVSANNAGIEMEKLLGYLAVTGEVTQKSMSSIGEGFKTIFTRMADIKAGKLELVDEDGNVESLSDVETVLNNMGIKLRESNNEFRDFGDVLDEVAAAWGSYSSVQQAAISKAFAGIRQSENFRVLMENYSSATSYMEAAMNSAGTAEQKFGAYLDSIEAKTKSLQAAFESLAVNTFSTELFGGIIEATTSLVTFLDKTNLLKSSLAGIAGAGAIKVFTMLASGIANAAVRMNEFNSALSILKSGNIGESQMQKLIQLTSNLSDSQLQAVVSSKALSTEQRMAILTANGMSTAEAQATLATMGLATAEGTATSATFSLSGALKGLWATLKANPLILVASAITAAVTAFSAFSDAAEEAAQRDEENFNKLTESAQAATETRKSVGSLIEQYKELADARDGSWSTEEANELKGIQEQITFLVGDQAGNLDLVNGKIDEEYQKLLSIYNLLSDDELASAESAYKVSQERFEQGYEHTGKKWTNSYSGDGDDLAAWYIMRAYEQVINPVEGADGNKWFAQKYLGWDENTNGYAGNLGIALEQIGSYEDGMAALKEWREILNNADDAEYFGDSFGNAYELGDAISYVNTKINEFQAVIDEAEAAKDRFFSAKANDEVLDFLVENDLNTQDDFDSWINSVMSNSDYSNDYKQALINAMQGYLPHFEIPDSVKKSLIANMDGLMDELTDHFTSDEDRNILSDWLMNMDPSEYQTFVNWWKENANSEVVTGSLDSMMTAFANHLERVSIAANGIATEVSGITSAAQKELINTQAVIDGISSAQGILSEQSTGVSLSVEDFNSEELKEYTSALEYNNGALQLNADKVNELVKANAEAQISQNDTNKVVAQSKYLENAAEIEKLRKQLDGLSDDESFARAAIQSNIDTLLAENSTLKNVCTQYDLMSASLREATSAYHNWINAQNATESGDMFDDALSAIQEINDTLNNSESDLYQRVNREGYKAAVDFIIPETIDHTDQAAINAYLGTVKSIFETNTDGDFIGLDIAGFCEQAVEQGLMVIDESTGDYRIAAGKTMEDFAQGLIDGYELPMALMQAFFGELGEFVQFDWSDEAQKTLGDLAVEANEAAESLRGLDSSIEINLDISDFKDSTEKAEALESTIEQMQELKKIHVDPESVEQANAIIRYCVSALHELEPPVTLSLDLTKLNADQATAAQMINDFELAYRNLDLQLRLNNTDGIADAKAEVERLRGELQLSQNACLVGLKLDYSSAETLRSDIESLTKTDFTTKWNIDDEAFITLQEESSETLKQEVKVEVDDREFNKFIKRLGSKDFVIRVVMDDSGSSSTKPSTKPSGGGNKPHTEISFGDAMAGGNYKSVAGKTLLGELGEELVVDRRTGKWYTVGSNGAEFVYLPKDAIVFDHLQTKDLLEHHFVSSRAHQIAGSAMVSGNAMVSGSIPKDLVNKLSSGGSSVSSNAHDVADDLEVFDWIEIAIEKISKAVEKLTDAASSAYKSLKTKLAASADAITLVNEQIAVQQAAYKRYMEEADAVGLSDELKQRVQSGALDLSEYDEDTQKLIEDYKEWYDKAQECSDGIDDLHESLAGLYEEQFNAIQEDYENQLDLLDHMTDSFDAAIEEQETRGYLVSTKLYAELQKVEQERIALLQKQLEDLEKSYSEAVNSDKFEGGAGALHDMQMAINDVKSEIQDATIALQEYNNELRNLEWERFDYQQERISALTDEANFLIDLLSSEKMYDENGKLTDAGQATIGLHGQNYNVYMAQADDYAKEIEDINRDLANDPNNTLLLERKEELLELQRESILAAEDEKQAMIALAEEGIQAEIDAMQKLVDVRKDALDSAKDLHDYQNKIEDHNEEIGNISKQLAAYKGDNSEETRAKIQKLQNDLDEAEKALEETEYDRYIEDQKKLLDDIMLEYEELLNQKLDNTDALIESMISSVNANSASISETITAAGDDVGYDLSEQMKAIWGSEGLEGVISVYGDEFDKELTAVNETLDDIKKYIESMVEDSDEDADEVIPDANPVVTPSAEPDKPNTDSEDDDDSIFQKKEPSKINPPGKPIENEITVGGRINAGNAKIYDYAGDTTGNNQYFSDNPIYTVIDEEDNYIQVRHHSLSSGVSGWFKKSDVKAYKTGGLVDYTGLAWVDGQKTNPEAFLDAEDTENIKILAEALKEKFNEPLTILNSSGYNVEHITPNIRGLDDISAMVSSLREQPYTNITSSAGDVNFNISIDHVQDYDDFVRQLQHDRKFEDMIGRMTADRMMGKGSLRKYQVNW